MINLNDNYAKLKDNFLFYEVNEKISNYKLKNPSKQIISLAVGDVSRPIGKQTLNAIKNALDLQSDKRTFKGYPLEEGYLFLRQAICNYYEKRNVFLFPNEIFINSGAGGDICNILDLLDKNTALIQNPSYPAYFDTNILYGNNIECFSNSVFPKKLEKKSYLIYLCSPNNPTGETFSRQQLQKWVEFALETKSLILFDIAYESFIEDDSPHFIYEIEGAKKCAIEIASFSKMAGFTGMRVGWIVVPKELCFEKYCLNKMWKRNLTTRFSGVPYFIQKGAEFALSEEGLIECRKNIEYYKQNAKILTQFCEEANLEFCGGKNSPYIWLRCPNNFSSWQMFDFLLSNAQVAVMPGVGFGSAGEGYIRLSCFASHKKTQTAIERIRKILWS